MANISFDLNDPKQHLTAIRDLLNAQINELPAEVSKPTVEERVPAADGNPDTDGDRAEDNGADGGEGNESGGAVGPGAGGAPGATATASSRGKAIDTGKVDPKGVPFDGNFCANATDPFYKSGKNEGQWKKKKGVDQAAYDDWYAAMLSQVETEPEVDEPAYDENYDTSAAFGAPVETQTAETAGDAPQDVGELMGWIAEQQTAGNLDQDKIGYAYLQAGVQVTDLFAGSEEDKAEKIGKVYAQLQVLVNA